MPSIHFHLYRKMQLKYSVILLIKHLAVIWSCHVCPF